jgi:hypothetical protein
MTSSPSAPPGTIASTGHYDSTRTRWYDDTLRRWLPLTSQVELLTIVLEVDGTGRWTRGSGTARGSSPVPLQRTERTPDDAPGRPVARRDGGVWPDGTLMRFVGRPTSSTYGSLPGEVHGRTFMRLRPVTDDLPPDEFHCPGMTDALNELRHRLAALGWIESGRRGHPWSFRYRRQLPDRSAAQP